MVDMLTVHLQLKVKSKKKKSEIMKVIDERETQPKTKNKDRKERGRQKL